MTKNNAMKRVAVIGAGAGGLCCARHLSRFPETFHFTVYEQSDQVGGTWVYSNPSPGKLPRDVRDEDTKTCVHSSIYKNLRTNLPKEIMPFPDFPFKDELPSFIHHSDVRLYLEKYTEHYNLNEFIRFKELVKQVSPLPESSSPGSIDTVKWSVTTQKAANGQRTTEEFDHILICNGHFFAPDKTQLKGLASFPRLVVHSQWYREPELFKNMSVLVVGAAASGRDLIIDLSSHARVIYLSSRKGPIKSRVPDNVEQLPGVSEFREDGRVCFENGEERSVDCVILATGYLYSYPFLTEESGIKVVGGKRVTHLYKHTFNVAHPSMAIVGVNFSFVPFPTFDLQVQWILKVWRGEKQLPPSQEMLEDVESVYQGRLKEGLPPSKAGHYLGEARWDFNDQLVKMGGLKPLSPLMKPIYDFVCEQRITDIIHYRETNITVTSEDEFTV